MSEPHFIILPIPIRDGVRVDVRIPRDLTQAEADKVARVVRASAAHSPEVGK